MRLLFSCVLSVTIAFASLVLDRSTPSLKQEKDEASRQTDEQRAALELAGLWEAKRRFGPDVRGTLRIRQAGSRWLAELAGRTAQANVTSDEITFEFPGGQGSFNGRFEVQRAKIVGRWIQPQTIEGGPYASPVTLARFGRDEWRGNVSPLEGTLTFYLLVKGRDDGSTGAFLRNPERNLGFTQYPVDQLQRVGDSVRLLAANKGAEQGRVLAEGKYDAERGRLSINFQNRGGFYDFRRMSADEISDFYPRGRPNATYEYAPPPAFDDGWQTASLEDVGISRPAIENFINMLINKPIDSARAPAVHGVLIARHGKLVLEEYFYGEHREKPHDTRSASKSLAADMVGAVINSGVELNASSSVYSVMNNGALPAGLEPRKRALTLEHVLTMSSGLDCDENDDKSPGFEDNMWEQTAQPDFYQFTMDLKMMREPGEKAVYCSAGANLAGGIAARAAKQPSGRLFHDMIAAPLQIKQYYMFVTPTGDYYFGGGARFMPRDFMKIGQLHVNKGMWNGRRILTPEWSARATSPLMPLGRTLRYGYLWWAMEYPYKGRTIRAFYAGGNGGQVVMGIPELDMVIAFYGGNYNDVPTQYEIQLSYIPKYILPALEAGR